MGSFPAGWGPSGVGSSQGWRFPRRESPRGLGPSDEPIKKHYAHIKEEFISLVLHSARSLSVNEAAAARRSTNKMSNSSTLNFFMI